MNNQKILVVDDDIAIRRLIWKSLQSTGVLIYQSDSIEKTLDIMTRVTFDLFLLTFSCFGCLVQPTKREGVG